MQSYHEISGFVEVMIMTEEGDTILFCVPVVPFRRGCEPIAFHLIQCNVGGFSHGDLGIPRRATPT